MRYTIILTLFAFLGLSLAAPRSSDVTLETAVDMHMSSLFSRDSAVDCEECHERRDQCIEFGMGAHEGSGYEESKCWKVCNDYLCRKWNDCKTCGKEFSCDDANLTLPPGWSKPGK